MMGAREMDELSELKDIKNEFTRFMMSYKFGIDEMMTKVNVLKDEFIYLHNYSPIEHVTSRLKSPESILKKAGRINCPLSVDDIRKNIWDIAGIRITCSFISDTYKISDMLTRQQDVNVIQFKNYIEHPKPNGYRSLHLIVEVPVFMSDRVAPVYVRSSSGRLPWISGEFGAQDLLQVRQGGARIPGRRAPGRGDGGEPPRHEDGAPAR